MTSPKRYERIALVASAGAEAQQALAQLVKLYGNHDPADADVVVALGGDGLMLQTLHRHMRTGKPIYGMHRGTVGFLMNEYSTSDLHARLAAARESVIHPLLMRATDVHGARAPSSRHQRSRAVPPDAPGGAAADHDRRAGAHGRADCRWHDGGDAGRIDRLQSLGAGPDHADQRRPSGADADQPVPSAPLARRAAARTPPMSSSRCWRATSGRWRQSPTMTRRATSDASRCCPTRRISMRMLFDPGHSLEERILSEQFGY